MGKCKAGVRLPAERVTLVKWFESTVIHSALSVFNNINNHKPINVPFLSERFS